MIRTALLLMASMAVHAADTAAFLASAKAPISPREVVALAKRLLGTVPPALSEPAIGGLPDAVVFHLDGRVNVVLEFPTGRPADTSPDSIDIATAVRVVRVEDHLAGLDAMARSEVLAVHDAPPIAPGFRGDRLLAAAVHLHDSGRERTLVAFERYLRLAAPAGTEADALRLSLRQRNELGWDETRIHLLARLLFLPRKGSQPWGPPRLGSPQPECRDILALPSYPVAMADGLPLLVVEGYELAGLPEPAAAAIAYARSSCNLVVGLPVPAADPIAVADRFAADVLVRSAFDDQALPRVVGLVRRQALAMRGDAPGGAAFLEPGFHGDAAHLTEDAVAWQQVQGLAAAAPVAWDVAAGRFVPAR